MCGIVAYSGDSENLINTLVSGLKRLEYRGYDSAGMAVITSGGVHVAKSVGKIKELEEKLKIDYPVDVQEVGIAHTRWATHGSATEANAHPHYSSDKDIWVVHNGIIENYQLIKDKLEKNKIKFYSETDTEVIAKLIGWYYKDDLKAAVARAIKDLEGAFAIAVISQKEPNRLIGAKKSSPLVLGVGDTDLILASDVSAIIERTNKVIYLEDGEIVDITRNNYEILSFHNQPINKHISHVDWDIELASKQGHKHYMLKEITEQPEVVKDSIRGRLVKKEGNIKFGGLISVQDRLDKVEHVYLLGVGTSFYAAKMGELYFNALAGIPASSVMSPEFRYTSNIINDRTWLIAISQSGETADTIAAVEEAKSQGALVTGLVNVVGSTIARITEGGVYNHIGPEISVASTKAFTSQSLLLLMHALMLGRKNKIGITDATEIIEAIESLPKALETVIGNRDSILKEAKKIHKEDSLLYIGRKYDYPIALEGALKIKEISYIHAEGLSGGELKHGFIALIDNHMTTIALAPNGSIHEKMISNISEVKARNGKVIAVANKKIKQADSTILVPDVGHELVQPLVNNVALQLLAYYTADLKGLDIDQPRNLAKSVTVE